MGMVIILQMIISHWLRNQWKFSCDSD